MFLIFYCLRHIVSATPAFSNLRLHDSYEYCHLKLCDEQNRVVFSILMFIFSKIGIECEVLRYGWSSEEQSL